MEALFWDIVDILNRICKSTGLSYASINILIYTLLAPASWALILSFRKRKYAWLLGLHGLSVAWFLLNHQIVKSSSQQFYDANIKALELMGHQYPDLGYIGVSIVAGVIMPIALWILLGLVQVRFVFKTYIFLICSNSIYYIWVISSNH